MRKVRVGFPVFTKPYLVSPGLTRFRQSGALRHSNARMQGAQSIRWYPTMMKIFLRLFAICFGALLAAAPAHADCFDEAAKYQKVNPLILRAIAWQESHNQPDAMNKNANGSIDYGLMQINSVHLSRLAQYGISTTTLMQPCKSVYIAAWHLRQKMNKYGNTWQAVGAYHSETPSLRDQYSRQIIAILGKWKLLTALR
jgi:soluble lytic murein transglycosylase-like protein